jgi:hypothetical protein
MLRLNSLHHINTLLNILFKVEDPVLLGGYFQYFLDGLED